MLATFVNIFLITTSKLSNCYGYSKVLYQFNGDDNGNIQPINPKTTKWTFQNRSWVSYTNDSSFQDGLKLPTLQYPDLAKIVNFTMYYSISRHCGYSDLFLSIGSLTEYIPYNGSPYHVRITDTYTKPKLQIILFSRGFCGEINRIQLDTWYIDCKLPAMHYFPAMRLIFISDIIVKCVENAVIIKEPMLHCEAGIYKISGNCSCTVGFQMNYTANSTLCIGK